MTEIRIVEQPVLIPGLFEDQVSSVFLLMDENEQPLETCATLPEAERKTRELLTPYLNSMAREYAEQGVMV
jgi:hypothetical protein